MQKGTEAFRSIGEVASMLGIAPHVLRYWETQFAQLRPMKRPDGRRYYRPEDVQLAAGLCEVLREEGLTIRGARKLLARDRGESVRQRGAERLARSDAQRDALSVLPPPEDPTMPAPRSRRRRRVPADAPPLPLFEEGHEAGEGRDPIWLVRLAGVADRLRSCSRLRGRARASGLALRDAILQLYPD